MAFIESLLLKNKLEKELRNENTNICFLLDYFSSFFKNCGVKNTRIFGGFCRELVYYGSWSKIEHMFSSGKKDFDITLKKNDFNTLKNTIKSEKIKSNYNFNIDFEEDRILQITFKLYPYNVRVDIVLNGVETVNFTCSSIMIDIYKKKIIGIKEISDFLDGKIRIKNKFTNPPVLVGRDFLGTEIFYFIKFCNQYNLFIDDVFIKQLKEFCRIVDFHNNDLFEKKILPIIFKKGLYKDYDYLKKIFHMFNIDEGILLAQKFEKYTKNINAVRVLDGNVKCIKIEFGDSIVCDIDFLNIYSSKEDPKNSIYFYLVIRTNLSDISLEIGIHKNEWQIEKIKNISLKDKIYFVKNDDTIEILVNNKKVFSECYLKRNMYITNTDLKRDLSIWVPFQLRSHTNENIFFP